MKYQIRDGVRSLQFEGELLAHSSSRIGSRPRWVEFKLFKTPKGTYVLSRTGISVYFHDAECKVVSRNRLSAVDGAELQNDYAPCPECSPNILDPEGVYPETPRYWAQSSDQARGVISSLMKYDPNGTEYLTNVAKRLLEDASEIDDGIYMAYRFDTIE